MLAKLRGIFERAHPNLDWQKDKRNLEICNRDGFSQEELKFLKLCRSISLRNYIQNWPISDPELLRITPPWESKLEDFWELAFVCDVSYPSGYGIFRLFIDQTTGCGLWYSTVLAACKASGG